MTEYVISEHYRWIANLPSSEFWMAKAGKRLALWFAPHGQFDARDMGIAHALVMALALWLLVRAFRNRPLWQSILAAAILLFVFTDIEYVQFFSTGYADAAAIVFFCCFTGVVLNLCLNPALRNERWMLAFTFFGCLFLSAKLQYELGIIPLCALAAWFAWKTQDRRRSLFWALPVAAFFVTAMIMVTQTRHDYRADPIYAMIFSRLAPISHDPNQVLKDFGLSDKYRPYIGTLPFQKGYLMDDLTEREYFVDHITLGRVAGYYLTHPGMCFRVLSSDLKLVAPEVNLGNWENKRFRMSDYAAHKNDMRFKWWSAGRQKLAAGSWLLDPAIYAIAFLWTLGCLLRPRLAVLLPAWPVVGLLCFEGASTFVVASLNDYIETARHIILFQVSIDLLVFVFLMEMVHAAGQRMLKMKAEAVRRDALEMSVNRDQGEREWNRNRQRLRT